MWPEEREAGAVAGVKFDHGSLGYQARAIEAVKSTPVSVSKENFPDLKAVRYPLEYESASSIRLKDDSAHDNIYGLSPKVDRNKEIGGGGDCPTCKAFPCACGQINQPPYVDYKVEEDSLYAMNQNLMFGIGGQIRDGSTDLGVDQFQNDQFWVTASPSEPLRDEILGNSITDNSRAADSYSCELPINVQHGMQPLDIGPAAALSLKKTSKTPPQTLFDNPLGPELKEAPNTVVRKVPVQMEHWKQQPHSNYLDIYSRTNCQQMPQRDHAQEPAFSVNPQVQKQKPVMLQQFFNQAEVDDQACPSPASTYFPSQDTPESDSQACAQQVYHTQKSSLSKLDGWAKESQDKNFLSKAPHIDPSARANPGFNTPQLNYVGMCSMGNISQLLNQEQFESQKHPNKVIPQVPYVYRTLEKHDNTHQMPAPENETYSIRSRHSTPRPKLHVTIPDATSGSTVHINSDVDCESSAHLRCQTGIDPSAYGSMLDIHPLSAPLNHARSQPLKMPYGDKTCMNYSESGYVYPYIQTFRRCNKSRSATTVRSPHPSLDLPLPDEDGSQLKNLRFRMEKGHYSSDMQSFASSLLSPPVEHNLQMQDVPRDFGIPTASPLSSGRGSCPMQPTNTSPKIQAPQFATVNMIPQPDPQLDKCGIMHRVHQQMQTTTRDALDLEQNSQYSNEEYFRCKYPGCNKTFPKLYNLKSHVVCHSDSKPHKCTMCGKAFARKHDLQRHLRTIHSSERPFQCDVCRGFFPGADALRKHKMTERSSQNKTEAAKSSRLFPENVLQKQQLGCE